MPATISLGPNSTLALTLPSPAGGTHTVCLPQTPAGLQHLIRILRAAEAEASPTIGKVASPTQHMVDAWLRNDAERRREEAAEALRKAVEGIELDLEDLEL